MDGARQEYERRVNRVVDHISQHLGDALSFNALARVAAFSPFHFHRVFRAITGETLFGFIQRLRLERSAGTLLTAPDRSILEVALDNGFSSAATFARAFKAHFGMSATAWRRGGAERWPERRQLRRKLGERDRKLGKQLRKRGNAPRPGAIDTSSRRHRTRRERAMSVQVRELPPQRVVYMRHVGPYGAHGIPDLWQRFATWMHARGFDMDQSTRLGVARDDPSITAADKCRYDACLVVPSDFQPDRSVNVTEIPGGRYAVSSFHGTAHDIQGAWDRVFSAWLPGSGFQPDDRPCFEVYRGRAFDEKTGIFRCDLCLPVRAL